MSDFNLDGSFDSEESGGLDLSSSGLFGFDDSGTSIASSSGTSSLFPSDDYSEDDSESNITQGVLSTLGLASAFQGLEDSLNPNQVQNVPVYSSTSTSSLTTWLILGAAVVAGIVVFQEIA